MTVVKKRWAGAAILALVTGCASTDANALCSLAGELAQDESIADADRPTRWFERAPERIRDSEMKRAMQDLAAREDVDADVIEARVEVVVDHPWRCRPLREIFRRAK